MIIQTQDKIFVLEPTHV